MLTKEKCKQALNQMVDSCYSRWYRYHGKNAKPRYLDTCMEKPVYRGDYRALKILEQLIKEHFDNSPLKFEELHEGMWVWDNGYKEWCYIYFIGGKYPHRKYIDNCESDGEFEENRFYRKQVK